GEVAVLRACRCQCSVQLARLDPHEPEANPVVLSVFDAVEVGRRREDKLRLLPRQPRGRGLSRIMEPSASRLHRLLRKREPVYAPAEHREGVPLWPYEPVPLDVGPDVPRCHGEGIRHADRESSSCALIRMIAVEETEYRGNQKPIDPGR